MQSYVGVELIGLCNEIQNAHIDKLTLPHTLRLRWLLVLACIICWCKHSMAKESNKMYLNTYHFTTTTLNDGIFWWNKFNTSLNRSVRYSLASNSLTFFYLKKVERNSNVSTCIPYVCLQSVDSRTAIFLALESVIHHITCDIHAQLMRTQLMRTRLTWKWVLWNATHTHLFLLLRSQW